ncbi:MAG TPA: ATP-dependent helicase [Planctomycetes bacterium]|nr:ATP-dependent helicase [Planctomycetota bacterium]
MAQLPPHLREAAARAGWTELMPVQARAIPYLRAGRDLMVQSRTGSGKTGAFVLPIIDIIDRASKACQALILVPTRELAQQVAREAELLGGALGVNTAAVYGGVPYGGQIEAFRRGAHIVVGTPGRILDHLLKRTLSFDAVQILILDEADRMLSMGFYPDMCDIKRYLRPRPAGSYMFSATFPPYVMSLAGQFLREPELLSLSHDRIHVMEVEHVFYTTPALDKDRALVRIIEIENPGSALIFCNTRSRVHYVSVVLQRFGYDADELSSDLTQAVRDNVLGRLRAGKLKFLAATDVAGRGIDLPELSHVIQYDFPEDPDAYIHRAGRTGRAGAAGVAISLVSDVERIGLLSLAKHFQINLVERPVPTDEEVAAIVSERLTALLEARLRTRDKLQVERMERFVSLARMLAQNEDGAALLVMLLDDCYQELLHAPAPQPEIEGAPEPRGEPRSRGDREGRGGGRSRRGGRSDRGGRGGRGGGGGGRRR